MITTRGGSVGPLVARPPFGSVSGKNGRDPDSGEGAGVTPAFVHIAPRSMPLPVLIAIPHAGRVYPGETLAQMRDPDLSQLRLEDRHIDDVGVEIARATGTGFLVAQAPRAMLDLNRAHDDVDWDMIAGPRRRGTRPQTRPAGSNARARSGLGLVPRRLPGFGEIWRSKLPREELDQRIDTIHRPYHEFLSQELERIRDAWGAALLVDLHSMPPLRSSHSSIAGVNGDGNAPAPQIVLGDRFGASCHSSLLSRAFRYLGRQGCVAAHNRPYAGGYVLDRHASPSRNIHAIQIEVCRSTYLDDALSMPTAAVKPLATMLAGLVRELGAETAGLGVGGGTAQAAE
ncbi:N-formylglutamate amidohydrolase [Erythrobacter sp. Alg231-14]|uniref:N-formylglutamate amidohydrolase n=1 Tax=Erythrobacter sp. Alg231-14 TaxID=1922225 RepID=UPI00307BD9AB